MRLRVAPEAEQELAEAAEWYEARRPGLGIEFVAIMDRELEEIVAAPLAHALWRSDRVYRRRVVKPFPYVIFFRAAQDEVVVVAFAHARRRPGRVDRGAGSYRGCAGAMRPLANGLLQAFVVDLAA